ncbi:MAG TPA: ATP-binding protein, partial [Burkholderiaceae bacterium]|nr:ATP-binding protein [Burkholderiaceae bacterium]
GRAAGGLGIGLSMAKMLVEVHGGTIEARSDGPGRGTELLVRIPCAGPDAQAGASPAATQVEGRDAELTDDAPTPV